MLFWIIMLCILLLGIVYVVYGLFRDIDRRYKAPTKEEWKMLSED